MDTRTRFVDSVGELNPRCRQILDESKNIFTTYKWYHLFENTITSPDDRIKILVVESFKDLPLLIAPFWVKRGETWRHPNTIRSLSNYYSCFYEPVISPDAESANVCSAMLESILELDGWDNIDLVPLIEQTEFYEYFCAQLDSKDVSYRQYYHSTNWYIDKIDFDFNDYLESRPSSLKNTYKRKNRALNRARDVKFQLYRNTDIDKAVRDYTLVYNHSWKKPEPYAQFIPELISMCAEYDILRLGILYVDGKPCAAQLWFFFRNSSLIYKQAHISEYDKYSVGTILSMHMFEYAIDTDKSTKIDYLTGDDKFKSNWMSERRGLFGIQIFNRRTVAGTLSWYYNKFSMEIKNMVDLARKR